MTTALGFSEDTLLAAERHDLVEHFGQDQRIDDVTAQLNGF